MIGLGALYVFTMGAITLAVEALAGLVGLAVAAATYLVLATPLLSGTSPYLLPRALADRDAVDADRRCPGDAWRTWPTSSRGSAA